MHSGYFLFVTILHLRNILLKAPVILMELFSAKLVTPEFSSEPSSQVVTLDLTSTQLFVKIIDSILCRPLCLSQLHSEVLDRCLLLSDHVFLFIELRLLQFLNISLQAIMQSFVVAEVSLHNIWRPVGRWWPNFIANIIVYSPDCRGDRRLWLNVCCLSIRRDRCWVNSAWYVLAAYSNPGRLVLM